MTVHETFRNGPAGTEAGSVQLWYTRCGVPTSFGIAVQRGLFRQEFADGSASLRAIQESTDPVVHQSHFTHAQENSFRHGSNYPAIWAQANGADTKVLGISWLRGAQTLLALAGSGIHSPADLKGKRLLVPRRPGEALDHAYANTIRFYEVALATAGLTLADVVLVERHNDRAFISDRRTPEVESGEIRSTVSFSRAGQWNETVFPLIRGEVDVITSGGGIGASSLQYERLLGLVRVFDLNVIADEVARSSLSSPLIFAVKNDLLKSRPDLVERVLYRALQAQEDAKADPDGTRRFIAREQAVPEILVRQAYGDDPAHIFNLDFAPEKITALKDQVQFLRRIGVIKEPIDVDTWLAPGHLVAARARLAARGAEAPELRD